ncbi:MAG TPA: glucosamine-6-phosphate deaminase [Acidobacteriaceae bacterium]|nr:glucosamine-6-phosphate deaminase [Acidobacteriaceae bacterium]
MITDFAPAISISSSRMDMGRKAASDVADELRRRLQSQPSVRMVFAAAPSQSEILAALVTQPGVDWPRVTAFHMDEYIGLAADASQRFGLWLRQAIFDKLPFAAVHLLDPGDDPEAAAAGYTRMLAEAPIDIVCLGIGVNGHLAFNDPPADLNDPKPVKVVHLDATCRQQQVDDGCFPTFDSVPTRALTLTIPRLLAADRLYCCVPGPMKREAVRRALHDPIGPDCPATALRLHPHCSLYLDPDSASA